MNLLSEPMPPSLDARKAAPLRRVAFAALGTRCELQYVAADGDSQAAGFERAAIAWVERFEAKFSRFRPDSVISRINAAAGGGWVEIDVETDRMLTLCDAIHTMTRGILDPTALPLMRLWNYKTDRPSVPGEAEIAQARRRVGWNKVRRERGKVLLPEPGMCLDLGGFGKEYAVDVVAQMAGEFGITQVLVDFGHDLRVLGRPPGRPAWHVGLEDPNQPGRAVGSIGVSDRGIASSGDYLRGFTVDGRRYGHIIDPRTGWPVANGCRQVTVVANTCLQAGILSTTAFVLGVPDALRLVEEHPGAEALIVAESLRAQTRGFFHYVVS